MKTFIQALMIIFQYLKNKETPCFTCEHDLMIIQGVNFEKMSRETMLELYNIGFKPGNPYDRKIQAIENLEKTHKKSIEEALNIFTEKDRIEIFKNCQDSLYSFKYGSC